jgi:nucleotide-binding universal stress UspA family protein
MNLSNIVVGVSAAPTSRLAARHAFELAALCGATVHVVTAVEDPEVTAIEVGSDSFHISDLDAAEHDIESFVASLAPAVPYRVLAFDNKPADALIEVAEQVGADLIVVGNVRMQGLGRVLGSVGNDVAHHAPCNVLIVKTV